MGHIADYGLSAGMNMDLLDYYSLLSATADLGQCVDLQCECLCQSSNRDDLNKYVQPRPYANPEAAARKLLEIAQGIEPAQDGRI